MPILDPVPLSCLSEQLPAAAPSASVDIQICHFQPMLCSGKGGRNFAQPFVPLFVCLPCRRSYPSCMTTIQWDPMGIQSLRLEHTTLLHTSCSWWATSERRCRSEASPQPTRRPRTRSRCSRPLCCGRAYVTVTLPYGAARSSHRLPLLEAAGGGFLASPASRGVGLPSRHLEGSGRPVWGRSEGAQPPPAREFGAQPPSSPSPDRPRVLLERRFRALGRRVIVLVAASRRADARRSRAERVARARRPSGPFAARQGLAEVASATRLHANCDSLIVISRKNLGLCEISTRVYGCV